MMRPPTWKHSASEGGGATNRGAALLLLAVALLTTLGWAGESWGQAKLPRVGILTGDVDLTSDHAKQWWEPFRRTLADQGWIEGKDVSFEFRKPSGDTPQFADAAAELVRLKVDVIWATSAPATRAAFAATRAIPIVGWDLTTDPVEAGYIEMLRPARWEPHRGLSRRAGICGQMG